MTNTDLTLKEKTAAIRKEFKAQGWTSKQISVRGFYAGYNEAIHITIKTMEIDINEVEAIARKYRYVDFDEHTMEVLQGGNTYMRVSYDYDAKAAAVNAIIAKCAEIIEGRAYNNKIIAKHGEYELLLYYLTNAPKGEDMWLSVRGKDGKDGIIGQHCRSFADEYQMANYIVSFKATGTLKAC